MSTFEIKKMTNPYGIEDDVSSLYIDTFGNTYILPDLISLEGEYIFSIWHKSLTNSEIIFNLFGQSYIVPSNSTWQKFSTVIEVTTLENVAITIAPAVGVETLLYESFLSEGNLDLSWYPAPEDLEDRFAKIELESDRITSTVFDSETGQSKIEQTAKEFTITLGNLEKKAIVSAIEQFYLSSSPTILVDGSWEDSQPQWAADKYIWRRTLVTYGNGDTKYTPSETGVCITGNTGADGQDGYTPVKGKDYFDGQPGENGQMLYTTSGTESNVADKVATLPNDTLLTEATLKSGTTVSVKFTYANTVSNPKLKVGSTNAKPIYLNGTPLANVNYYWTANSVVTFVYDDANWNISDAGALLKANEAYNAAHNYMRFTDTGLCIGDHTASTLGRNVNVGKDGIDFRNGTDTIYATYRPELIQLGQDTGRNLLLDGNGLTIRDGQTALASYGAEKTIIGREDKSHFVIDEQYGMSLYSGEKLNSRFWDDQILLGAHSDDIVIKFGEHLGEIRYETEDKFLGIDNPHMSIWTSNQLSLDSNMVELIGSAPPGCTGSVYFVVGKNWLEDSADYHCATVQYRITDASDEEGEIIHDGTIHSRGIDMRIVKSRELDEFYSRTTNTYHEMDIGSCSFLFYSSGFTMGNSTHQIIFSTSEKSFRVAANGSSTLGTSSYKWGQIYSTKSAISTSDRNLKKNINLLTDKYEMLFEKLEPVSFEFKATEDQVHDRTHIGFVSQDVERALVECEMTALDFGGFCKDVKKRETEEGTYETICDEDGNPEHEYSLRYEEFIALNTHMLQKALKEIADLKAEINELKQIKGL